MQVEVGLEMSPSPIHVLAVDDEPDLCALQLWAVAERRKVEENARSSEERHRTILETLGVG